MNKTPNTFAEERECGHAPTESAEAMLAQVDAQEAEEALARDGIDVANDEAFADWYANRILALEEEENRVSLQTELRLRQIRSRATALQTHFGPKVEEAVRRLLGEGKKKSVTLTSGTLGFRASTESATYDSIDRVKAFAEKYPPAANAYTEETRIVPKVAATELKRAISQYASEHEGEIPEGLGLIGGGDRFYVKPPKAKE